MKRLGLSILLACSLAACSGEIGSGGGGSAGSGGGTGSGGTPGTGGSAGSGGSGGRGGSAGAGGSGGVGGAAGIGGSSGSGGDAGTGGSGGMAGGGGAPALTGLDVVPFITGLDRPWDIAWLPNGTVLVTERPGPLNVYDDGVDQPPFVIQPADLVVAGEGGMLGLEVDPSFATNGYVYVCMCSNASGSNDVRVVRYTLATPNGDGVIARDDIVTGMPYNDTSAGRHSGCRPRFGPDDYLYVGTGDAAIGTTPQDDDSLGGKVLKIDRNGGAAPGNPGGRLWVSKGHRNIQGMAFRASDDLGVSAQHGPAYDDEVNLLVPGNFGWDPVPGYNESVPMTDLVKFPGAIEAIWSSGSPTLALSGATFIEGSQWADWDGVLGVATLKATHLHIFFVDGAGAVTGELEVIDDQGRLRSPRQGPDGLLYVTTDGSGTSGEVLRVTPVVSP